MRTGAQLKALGVDSWFHQHARQYVRLLENAGWSDQQIDKAIEFGVNFKGGSEAELMQQFRELGEYHGAPELDLVTHAAMGVRDVIMGDGVETLPPLPVASFTRDDADRLSEIRAIARSDPEGYERNPALQAEQLALLEAQHGAKGVASPSQASIGNTSPAGSGSPLANPRDRAQRSSKVRIRSCLAARANGFDPSITSNPCARLRWQRQRTGQHASIRWSDYLMAYSQDNLFMLGEGGIGGSGPRVWLYAEAIAAAALDASGYISNGKKLGMKVNDLVLGLNTATGIWSGHTVVTANATTGAIDLSNGTTIADGSSNTD